MFNRCARQPQYSTTAYGRIDQADDRVLALQHPHQPARDQMLLGISKIAGVAGVWIRAHGQQWWFATLSCQFRPRGRTVLDSNLIATSLIKPPLGARARECAAPESCGGSTSRRVAYTLTRQAKQALPPTHPSMLNRCLASAPLQQLRRQTTHEPPRQPRRHC